VTRRRCVSCERLKWTRRSHYDYEDFTCSRCVKKIQQRRRVKKAEQTAAFTR
jgi:hypothetical protein